VCSFFLATPSSMNDISLTGLDELREVVKSDVCTVKNDFKVLELVYQQGIPYTVLEHEASPVQRRLKAAE
jgi:hypothetical protein